MSRRDSIAEKNDLFRTVVALRWLRKKLRKVPSFTSPWKERSCCLE